MTLPVRPDCGSHLDTTRAGKGTRVMSRPKALAAPRNAGYDVEELEVLVQMQQGAPAEFGGGGDQQVVDGRCAVLPSVA